MTTLGLVGRKARELARLSAVSLWRGFLGFYRSDDLTYAASLQTMALCAGDPARDRALITCNVRWIESRQVRDGASIGMWAQPASGSPDHIDNSMTHMAMLALYEAERVGVAVNAKT